MDLTRVKWWDEISCARSSDGAGDRNPSLGFGGSSLTCSSSTYSLKGDLEKASKIYGGWIEKFIRGSGVTIEGMCSSFGKRSKTEEVDRKERKWESSTKERCSQNTTLQEIPLLSFAIAKKTTKSRPKHKLVMLMWLKKKKTCKTKGAKVVIVWRWPKKVLIWSLILDDKTGNVANSMNSMKSSFDPKRSRNFGREKENTNSVKNMTKFLFSSTIFLRGTWIG